MKGVKMGADNWTVCPKCVSTKTYNIEKEKLEARKSYGKVTPEKFLQLINNISNEEGKEQERTLREDYEIGIDKYGQFSINYSAYCSQCKFKHKYEYTTSILLVL